MGITIAIQNDVKYTIKAAIALKGGVYLTQPTSIPPGVTWKRTDQGISASCPYWIMIYHEDALEGPDQMVYKLHIRAPSATGTKLVKVSEVISKGKRSVKRSTQSRRSYIETLWSNLDVDNNGSIDFEELSAWVSNEYFVRNRAFSGVPASQVVADIFRHMDTGSDSLISKKEFIAYFSSLGNSKMISEIGHTVLDSARATIESAALPFRALDTEGNNYIPTEKHFSRWFAGKARDNDKRTLALYKQRKAQITALKKKKDITFWEWMNFMAPVGNPVVIPDKKKAAQSGNDEKKAAQSGNDEKKAAQSGTDVKGQEATADEQQAAQEAAERAAALRASVEKKAAVSRITETRLLCQEVLGLCLAPNLVERIAPKMNVVIMIVGSRGDVQPFIPIGQNLKKIGHRVRIATHANFRDFVTRNGLEFFPIGGDPKKLMAYMVKTKGQLMPGVSQILSKSYWKDVKQRLGMMEDIIMSGWDGANGTDVDGDGKPFRADVIISNPTTYSHVHLAEAMGVPLHMFFTMPWSPTSAFPHPLGNVSYEELKETPKKSTELTTFLSRYKKGQGKKKKNALLNENVFSYAKVDMLMHVGMADLLQKFRQRHGLEKKWREGSGIINSRQVPFAYIWSPSLIPKPEDWGRHVDVVGFCELKGSGFTKPPPKDIDQWIKKDPKRLPIFLGFGSCVLPDADAVGEVIYGAAKKAGIRVIVQQGWAGLGRNLRGKPGVSFVKGAKYADGTEAPELDLKIKNDFCLVIGRVAHSWLFDMVAGVCHHGGAGTTYAGLMAARPTLVAPFFGDQPFWGQMVNNAGAGPKPKPVDKWTVDDLAEKFESMYSHEMKACARRLSRAMKREDGADEAVRVFHEKLSLGKLECDLLQTDVARYFVPNWQLKLGERALYVLLRKTPKFFNLVPGRIHRYKSCNWALNNLPGYGEEILEIDFNEVEVKKKDVEIVTRNLKAILSARKSIMTESKMSSRDGDAFIHPDPRKRG